MTTSSSFTDDDFLPLIKQPSRSIERPSISYWRNAWLKLKKNKSAFLSLILIIGLLVFTLFGSFFWSADPYDQDLMQVSRGPSFTKQALVIPNKIDYQPIFKTNHAPFVAELAPESLAVMGTPTTEAIMLTWEPVAGAGGYHIFRHEYPPYGRHDLGIPLGEIDNGDLVSYIDALQLENIDYYYSVVPVFNARLSDEYSTIRTHAQQAITLRQAIKQGLIKENLRGQKLGKTIRLPSHPLGTDYLGRDMLARLIQGGKVSLFIGIVAPLIFIFLGLLYGGISGYLGGKVDEIMMRFVDFVIALPFLLFMILLKVAFGIGPGESGIFPLLIALILLSWPSTARLIRGQMLKIREEPYMQAAKLMGANPHYLIMKHMMPNVLGLLLVSITFAVPSAIFTEAFLSFIGMGVAPPTPSWGSMCNDGMPTLLTHPHELLFPALFISITVLAFNLLGDGLRDALDVKSKGES